METKDALLIILLAATPGLIGAVIGIGWNRLKHSHPAMQLHLRWVAERLAWQQRILYRRTRDISNTFQEMSQELLPPVHHRRPGRPL